MFLLTKMYVCVCVVSVYLHHIYHYITLSLYFKIGLINLKYILYANTFDLISRWLIHL